MKKIILTFAALAACSAFCAYAQDNIETVLGDAAAQIEKAPSKKAPKEHSKYWTNSFRADLNIDQTALNNWAAGGDNTIALGAAIDASANYAKEKDYWNNRLQLDYGFLYASSKPILQKSKDRIYLQSKYGRQFADNLSITIDYSFRTQFTKGYSYNTPDLTGIPDDIAVKERNKQVRQAWRDSRDILSDWLSPAYTTLSVGIDYKPTKWLNISFSPVTGGFVIVESNAANFAGKTLRETYGMALCNPDDPSQGFRSAKFEFGAQLKIDANVAINDVFSYGTQVVLFEDYLKNHRTNPCPRINWDNKINWKVAKFFSLSLNVNMIYDDAIMIHSEKDGLDKARLQIMETLGFGFTYTIASKK